MMVATTRLSPSQMVELQRMGWGTVTPLDSSPNYTRLQMWNNQLTNARATIKFGLEAAESLPARSDQPWLRWRSLNHLHTGIGRAKTSLATRSQLTATVANRKQWPTSSAASYLMSLAPLWASSPSQSGQIRASRSDGHVRSRRPGLRGEITL